MSATTISASRPARPAVFRSAAETSPKLLDVTVTRGFIKSGIRVHCNREADRLRPDRSRSCQIRRAGPRGRRLLQRLPHVHNHESRRFAPSRRDRPSRFRETSTPAPKLRPEDLGSHRERDRKRGDRQHEAFPAVTQRCAVSENLQARSLQPGGRVLRTPLSIVRCLNPWGRGGREPSCRAW